MKLVQKAFFVCFHGVKTGFNLYFCTRIPGQMEFGNSVTFSRSGGTFEIQEGSFPSWGKTNDKLNLHLNDQVDGDH